MIGKESDDEDSWGNETKQLQEAQGPHMEQTVVEAESNADMEPHLHDVDNVGQPSSLKLEVGSKSDEWNITTPNIQPPHVEWPLNTKELEVLMPKEIFLEFAKRVFADSSMWTTKSWEQEKFTISRATHPEVCRHWAQRHKLHMPSKTQFGQKVSSIYPPFLRLLIAEFLLKWKVDYTWENEFGKRVTLQVHPSVNALTPNKKETRETKPQPPQIPSVFKGKKRVNDLELETVPKKERTDSLPFSFVSQRNVVRPSIDEFDGSRRKTHSTH
jgi:hypothetical protein